MTTSSTPAPGAGEEYEAPDDLEVVRLFVNSYDTEKGTETIGSAADLRAWIAAHDLPGAVDPVDEADAHRARAVREALRALMLANHDAVEPDPTDVEVLDTAGERATLSVRFAPDGSTSLQPSAAGLDAALAALLSRVRTAMVDGRWSRLKVCPADDCRWAYYDSSRNRSRRWCSMEVCGNRAKVRRYRARQDPGEAAR